MSDDISFDVEKSDYIKNIVGRAAVNYLNNRRPSKFIKTDLKLSVKQISSPTLGFQSINQDNGVSPGTSNYYEKVFQTVNSLKDLLRLMVLLSSARSFENLFELFYNESPKTFQCEQTFIIFYSFTKDFKIILISGETITFSREQAAIIESTIESDEITMINKKSDERLEIYPIMKIIDSNIRNILISPIKDKNEAKIGAMVSINKTGKKRFTNDDLIMQKYLSMIIGSLIYFFKEDEGKVAIEYSLRRVINFTSDFGRYNQMEQFIVHANSR